mmetsp:Transcript_21742/g.43635  ORF Transcript_21742/g.43635 Transcript_21742/m.43635 type:complete len:91 (+) Transcript_21742:110-382(+)
MRGARYTSACTTQRLRALGRTKCDVLPREGGDISQRHHLSAYNAKAKVLGKRLNPLDADAIDNNETHSSNKDEDDGATEGERVGVDVVWC